MSRGMGRGSSAESPEVEKRKGLMGSPVENVELLYEYFPLSLDDWFVPPLISPPFFPLSNLDDSENQAK